MFYYSCNQSKNSVYRSDYGIISERNKIQNMVTDLGKSIECKITCPWTRRLNGIAATFNIRK